MTLTDGRGGGRDKGRQTGERCGKRRSGFRDVSFLNRQAGRLSLVYHNSLLYLCNVKD